MTDPIDVQLKVLRDLQRSLIARKGGSVRNPKRAAASARNGKLGGRPRKLVAA